MNFNEAAKAETQRLSILIDKTNNLCRLFRTSDIPKTYLKNAKMLRNPKNARGVNFTAATAIETALDAFKRTQRGAIDKRTISDKKLSHLLGTLKIATTIVPEKYTRHYIALEPTPSFNDATSLWRLPMDGPRQKDVRANRQMTNLQFTKLKMNMEEIEDILILRSFNFRVAPQNIRDIGVVFEQIEPVAA